MVAGGGLHGEKSGIYHFSTQGQLYELARRAELTACLAFSRSSPHRVRVIFTSLLTLPFVCYPGVSLHACASEHVRRWMLLPELHRFQEHQPPPCALYPAQLDH